MPQTTTVVAEPAWSLLTDADVTAATFQNVGGYGVYVTGTNGTTQPAASAAGVLYNPGQGEAARALSDLFPGVSGVNRLWVRASAGASAVFVSHA